MPLYEYKCRSCGKTFEVIQKFSDDPLKTHAECGGEVERLLSAPAFHLKGTGWYATDYAKPVVAPAKTGEGKSDDAKSGSESKSDSKSESGKDSKPAESKPATESKTKESKTTESKPATVSTADSK